LLSNTHLTNVNIANSGIGTSGRHDLWIRDDAAGALTISHSRITDIQNNSANFSIGREP